jgi:hypothetical protein
MGDMGFKGTAQVINLGFALPQALKVFRDKVFAEPAPRASRHTLVAQHGTQQRRKIVTVAHLTLFNRARDDQWETVHLPDARQSLRRRADVDLLLALLR